MINKLKNRNLLKILKSCLDKTVQDIFVTGWTEIQDKYYYFSAMGWWYYFQFDDLLFCLSAQDNGMLHVDIQEEIKCNFDIEDEDEFTIMRVNSVNEGYYTGWKVVGVELFFGDYYPQEPAAVGFQCKYFNEGSEKIGYIFFDAMNIDGIVVGDEKLKKLFLEDERYYFEKIV